MCKYDKAVGPFWVVWDKIVGPVAEFDSDEVTRGDQFWRLECDLEEVWKDIREFNEYPNKPFDYYPHGEVMFDAKNHKFTVVGTPKLMNDIAFQKKIIRQYGLNSFTRFIKE